MYKEQSFAQSSVEMGETSLEERWLSDSNQIAELIKDKCPVSRVLELDDPLCMAYPNVEISDKQLVEGNEKMPKWMRGPYQRFYEFGSSLTSKEGQNQKDIVEMESEINKLSRNPQDEFKINSLLSDFIEKRIDNLLKTLEKRFSVNVNSIKTGEEELLKEGAIDKVRTVEEIENSLKERNRSVEDIRSSYITAIQDIKMADVYKQDENKVKVEETKLEGLYKEGQSLKKELTGGYSEYELWNVQRKDRGKITGIFSEHDLGDPYKYDKRFIG